MCQEKIFQLLCFSRATLIPFLTVCHLTGDIQAEEMASSVVFVETLENGIKVKIVEDNGRGVGINGETETVNGEMGTVNRLMEAINRGMEMVNGLMETINGGMEMVMKENSPMVEREEGSPVEGSGEECFWPLGIPGLYLITYLY